MKKLMSWKTKGMNRDLSVSAFNPEFAFENRNLRLGTNESNTMMSWVNERGTKRISIVNGYWNEGDTSKTTITEILGTPIGTAVINHQLVVFTTDTLHNYDYIYVLKYADSAKENMLCKMLFGGENLSLGFRVDHPLETLVNYESEKIQKVYWTDGINQPRVINIEGNIRKKNNTQFDFVPTLQLQEKIEIKKILGASGVFAPGVIQYAFTYYTKYGQESNIFYTSPLLYISYRDRGGSPEDKVENAFRIIVEGLDMNFDYLRIYSIQRTSINATPICKRIQDIELAGLKPDEHGTYKASFLDTGTTGENVDPTELLYVGGETITADTIEQKDNTLFFGNINISRPQIDADKASGITSRAEGLVGQGTRKIVSTSVSTGSYVYSSQLTSYDADDPARSVPCGGFKAGETYRLGVQFQYESGKWSDPVFVKDDTISNIPSLSIDNVEVTLPIFTGSIAAEDVQWLISHNYKRVRGVVVFPNVQDRTILCQGVANPTMYTQEHRNNGDLYAQASWFFRACGGRKLNSSNGTGSPASTDTLPYTHRGIDYRVPYSDCTSYNPSDSVNNIRLVEIQGDYNDSSGNKFKIDRETVTFHSPDIEFDTQMSLIDYANTKYRQIGYTQFIGTMSDIDIQTETATISNSGAGFVHKSFSDVGTYGIIAGLFYDDFVVDDGGGDSTPLEKYSNEYSSCKWMVYPWHKSGSLNNDINRPSDQGVASSILKKKVISNLRYANTYISADEINSNTNKKSYRRFPQVFNSDQPTILKLSTDIYMGNIDTTLISDNLDGEYLCMNARNGIYGQKNIITPFTNNIWYKMFSKNQDKGEDAGIYHLTNAGKWDLADERIADTYLDLVIKRSSVRMKYKSSPHLAFAQTSTINWYDSDDSKQNSLPVLEVLQDPELRFGGTSKDAFRENIWLPCGEPKLLTDVDEEGKVNFNWEYGDTYFQRWDCLKTYPFTFEDPNQIVEIGSFFLESHVNIDGRYDRNRGQMNNLNMSPINFNLLNPVYSQKDNFFQYRIQDEDYYKDTVYPNQITWSKVKSSGAEVDLWTNVTLASTLELDGDKGEITSIQKFNNNLICFQDTGISRIAYNESYQITTTEGVPVEIANSGKVNGKDYINGKVGCSNKWSIVNGTLGLYFMDSDGKNIYLFNGQLVNLSTQQGFNSWSKLYIPSNSLKWTPIFPENYDKSAFVSYYDKLNQEIMFINHNMCLAFSEKFGVFTSFYDYHNTPYFNNLDDTGIWLRANQLWKHQAGDYCRFFGALRPYSMVLVGNPEPLTDKIFTNLEFRACVDGDGSSNGISFTPYLPFDSLDTWNEYQHGIAYLNNMRGQSAMQHHTLDNEASLKRKFRIWRCDIPRDNGENIDTFDETFDDTFHPLSRSQKHPMDRMRNPWLYLRLRKDEESSHRRAEIHDIVMTYFD